MTAISDACYRATTEARHCSANLLRARGDAGTASLAGALAAQGSGAENCSQVGIRSRLSVPGVTVIAMADEQFMEITMQIHLDPYSLV